MGTHTCRVELKTDDLISALRSLKAAQRVGKIVRVTFRDEQLEFTRGETAARVPATGTWPMSAGVAVRLVKDLLSRDRSLPATLVVTGSDTMLHFNHVDELQNFAFHYAIPCSWEIPSTGSAVGRKPAAGPPNGGARPRRRTSLDQQDAVRIEVSNHADWSGHLDALAKMVDEWWDIDRYDRIERAETMFDRIEQLRITGPHPPEHTSITAADEARWVGRARAYVRRGLTFREAALLFRQEFCDDPRRDQAERIFEWMWPFAQELAKGATLQEATAAANALTPRPTIADAVRAPSVLPGGEGRCEQ